MRRERESSLALRDSCRALLGGGNWLRRRRTPKPTGSDLGSAEEIFEKEKDSRWGEEAERRVWSMGDDWQLDKK